MTTYVLIVYRNFAKYQASVASHVGLGVNALHTAAVLRRAGIRTDVAGVWTPADVTRELLKRSGVTHCVIEAPWIPTSAMQGLLNEHPDVQFVMRSHSQIGFLQVEAGAITLFRQAAVLQDGSLNFHVAANSERFCRWFGSAYRHRITCLPNLYDLNRTDHHYRVPFGNGHRIRVGSFGAIRLMKNHTTAASVAMVIARRLRVDLEFYMSVNREEHGKGVLAALRNMFAGLNWARLIEVPWAPWPEFRNMVGTMDLGLQLSHSETFNIVTADLAATGVPSVVSEAIDWAPPSWQAPVDDTEAAAQVGLALVMDPMQGQIGREYLDRYTCNAIGLWKQYLATARNVIEN